ncbi:hypothetical protein BD779DRAFT_1502197 [Infundibulicybe gibba]|nr:hypothetical protein BD779DRAFT_1502197 [Infundibulicybe gibba]
MGSSSTLSLRIETGFNDPDAQHNIRFSLDSPAVQPSSPSAQAFSLPSFRVSVSPQAEKPSLPPRSPTFVQNVHKSSRARNESRKLLAHLLRQLQSRPMPPSVFDSFANVREGTGDSSFMDIVKGSMFRSKSRDSAMPTPAVQVDYDSDDDGTEKGFSTDATYELMTQLKEVLVVSISQGWQIFDDGSSARGDGGPSPKSSSPFRRSRNSLQPLGKRSRSPSPASRGQVEAPELLSTCISILGSIISEDCRYHISSPRPSKPPNALQALTLDVAQFLLHVHRHDAKIMSQIGFAIIPAFSTFQPAMHLRLLKFFEEGIIWRILEQLRQVQGIKDITQEDSNALTQGSDSPPIVSIQVEAAHDEFDTELNRPQWMPWPSDIPTLQLRSTNAPAQQPAVYHLASLFPPLLAALLQSIPLTPQRNPRAEVLHRFYRLLDLIISTKPDAYADLLQVVAYDSPRARYSAITLLATLWPKAIGHVAITRPFAISSYANAVNIKSNMRWPSDHAYAHQFVPWRFTPVSSHGVDYLYRAIDGFGLLCPYCMCGVHLDCYEYPDGSHIVQYAMASDRDVQRVAVYRSSTLFPSRRDGDPPQLRTRNHIFRVVNMFTLGLCFVCQKPLWGVCKQGLKCLSCLRFIHAACVSSDQNMAWCGTEMADSQHVVIEWSVLRVSYTNFYHDIIHWKQEDLRLRSYEELSILRDTLWTQLQIMTNGVALGSIVVMQNGKNAAHVKNHKVDEFELHHTLEWCEACLASNTISCSVSMDDFLNENHLTQSEHFLMFDWSNLAYISTMLKSACASNKFPTGQSSDLLNVASPETHFDDTESPPHPFEVVPLSHMREVLGHELLVYSDVAARLFLTHVHSLGFFERLDRQQELFDVAGVNKSVNCVFPLPLGLDLSTDVETLVSSVEACLLDLDLSVNEVGFLLLVRRLWPNGLSSEYALRRLTRNIVSWILAEDVNLGTILRDYLAKQRDLPGVRSANEPPPWPSAPSTRPTPTSSVNNGGDYVASRRALLNRYVMKWLLALHDQDPVLYALILYDVCMELADDCVYDEDIFATPRGEMEQKTQVKKCGRLLHSIVILAQASLSFSVFENIFVRSLDYISDLNLFDEPMSSLYRLFPREADTTQRLSTFNILSNQGDANMTNLDPWRAVISIATKSKSGLSRSLRWLCLFACSGVEIPDTTLARFSVLAYKWKTTLTDSLIFAKAVMYSVWLKSMGRSELQRIFATLHARHQPQIVAALRSTEGINDALSFIRRSLATCLLLYGCDRTRLIDAKLIELAEVYNLPSRRKLHARGSMMSDPIIVDPELMNALESYTATDVDDVSVLVAKFLNFFLTDSPYLEPFEIDNFILRNGGFLATCAWQFYRIQRPEICNIRTSFLLRTLVVDSVPFQNILRDEFLQHEDWQRRLLAATCLSRIILDVTSPHFNVDDRQWQSSVTDIFCYYFTSLWADENAQVRLSIETFAGSLLSAHHEAISRCWNESLATAPITERVRLVSFLIQFRAHFPSWKVLSWEAIVDATRDDEGDNKTNTVKSRAATHNSVYGFVARAQDLGQGNSDADVIALRVSVLVLSLQMIADGIPVDPFSLMKVKLNLAQMFKFENVAAVPSTSTYTFRVEIGAIKHISEVVYPCVGELLSVLDAPHPAVVDPTLFNATEPGEKASSPLLIGSLFVDAALGLVCSLEDADSIPILVTKNILEGLCIIIHKHDFENPTLRYLQPQLRQAVTRVIAMLSQDVGYEIRQIALSTVQAFIQRWHSIMRSIIYTAMEAVTKLAASQSHLAQDALLTQARQFIEAVLSTYSNNALFPNLLKRPLDPEFFAVLKFITDANAKASPTSESLRDELLRDAMAHVAENDHATFQAALKNLETYIKVVHHQGLSANLMVFSGQSLTQIARRASEPTIGISDASPLLGIPTILIQHNKAQSRDMLPYVETIVRIVLQRLNIDTATLAHLLHATTNLYRKFQSRDHSSGSNSLLFVLLEILGDGLRLKARISSQTLRATVEV